MSDEQTPSINIKARIDQRDGMAAVGTDIRQIDKHLEFGTAPTADELAQLRSAFAALRDQIAREAPADVRERALERVDELEQATDEKEPDVSVMAAAKRWFVDHVPTLVGAVTAVIINPIVGKVVQSAGDALAEEYRRKFPEATTTPGP